MQPYNFSYNANHFNDYVCSLTSFTFLVERLPRGFCPDAEKQKAIFTIPAKNNVSFVINFEEKRGSNHPPVVVANSDFFLILDVF